MSQADAALPSAQNLSVPGSSAQGTSAQGLPRPSAPTSAPAIAGSQHHTSAPEASSSENLVSALDRTSEMLGFSREGFLLLLTSLVMLGIGLWKNINLIILLTCFLLVIVVGNFLMARRQLKKLRGRRLGTDAFHAQTPFTTYVEVENLRKAVKSGVALFLGKRMWFLPRIEKLQTIRLQGQFIFPQRGKQRLEMLRAQCGYPLGLARSKLQLQAAEEIIVLPRLGDLRRGVFLRFIQMRSPIVGQARTVPRRVPTARTEFHGLREFRPGDSPRWIHWRTTARLLKPMVREFEETPSNNLILLVDAYRPLETSGHDADLERAISLAATICREWCRQKGDRLAVAVVGQRTVLLEGVTTRDFALATMEALAVEPGCDAPDVDGLLAALETTPLPTAPVMLISPRVCPYLELLEQKLHRHLAYVNVAERDERDFFELDDGEADQEARDGKVHAAGSTDATGSAAMPAANAEHAGPRDDLPSTDDGAPLPNQ